MLIRIVVIIIFTLFLQSTGLGQESGGHKSDQSMKSKRKFRKEDKKKWREDRRNKRAEEKKIRKYHKRLQTKDVQKRMKRSKATSTRNNANEREPFFKRLFQKKRGKGHKHHKEKETKVKQ